MYKFLYDYKLEWFHGNVHLKPKDLKNLWKMKIWDLSVCPWPTKKNIYSFIFLFLGGNFFTSYSDYSPNLIIAYKTRIFPIKFFFFFLCAHCVHSHFYTFFSSLFVDGTSLILFFCCIICFASLFRWRLQKKRFFCCYAL